MFDEAPFQLPLSDKPFSKLHQTFIIHIKITTHISQMNPITFNLIIFNYVRVKIIKFIYIMKLNFQIKLIRVYLSNKGVYQYNSIFSLAMTYLL